MKSEQSIPTLQDVLDKVETLEAGTKKRDLKSAVMTFCRVVGKSPRDVLVVPNEIRALRESVSPIAAGLTERRWANVCSGLTKAIELVRELVPSRNTTPLLPEWRRLLDALPNKLVRKLSAGMRYLSGKGVTPTTVTAADLQEYCEAIVADRMRRNADKAVDALIWAWNRTVMAYPAWPQVTLPRKDKRDTYTYPLDFFPASFAADIEAYIGRLTQGILFDDDDDDDEIDLGPLRPVRPATVQTRRRQLRAAASCLVHSGVPASEILSIATLVELKNARLILHFLMQRQGGQRSGGVAQMATLLAKLALHWAKVSPEHHTKLRRLTKAAFGESISPHRFRDMAASTIASHAPEYIHAAAPLLGHATLRTTEKYYRQARAQEGQIVGNKQVLAAAVTGQSSAPARVRGFVRKWRARQDSNLLPQD